VAASSASDVGGPLSHIRVLDLTEFLAGPYGTQILGDLGAEIIKVESVHGDSSRSVPPNFVAGSSTYFTCINRNKKSIVIDLKTPEGVAIVRDLARKCDVLFENRRPGVLGRMGLSYEDIARENPGIVWCSVSGFGQDGPDRDHAAYDMIVQAMSGGMSLTGEKGGRPVRAGVPIGDMAAGMYGVIGILAALTKRAQTGLGDYIDVAMLDVQVSFLNYQAANYLHSGKVPGRQGREHDSLPTYRCFEARDGVEIAITANTEKMWQDMCRVLDEPQLIDDPRFLTVPDRNAHRGVLIETLEAAFKKKDAREWVQLLRDWGVPVGPVNTVGKALEEPQVLHRGMVLELVGEEPEQRARVAGDPIKLKRSRRAKHQFPPKLGGDTRDVLLNTLGYDAARVEALLRDSIVSTHETLSAGRKPAPGKKA
jgi:CoA:oxalate CoA-transferase